MESSLTTKKGATVGRIYKKMKVLRRRSYITYLQNLSQNECQNAKRNRNKWENGYLAYCNSRLKVLTRIMILLIRNRLGCFVVIAACCFVRHYSHDGP